MKLLFDENLSRKLVELVRDLFPGSAHGLSGGTSEREIWDYAKQSGFALVTADTDFVTLANTLGHPPKVIILGNCDYPTRVAAQLITANRIRIFRFEGNDHPLLILRRP